MIIFLFFVSCSNFESKKISDALKQATLNHTELRKALEYFKKDLKDSLKLKACEFLIENMPGHYSYCTDSVFVLNDELVKLSFKNPFLFQAVRATTYNDYVFQTFQFKKEDIKHITGDFLIRHINHCFNLWKRLPWLRQLTFDEFCDFILPYRVGYEHIKDIPNLLDSSWLLEEKYQLICNSYDDIHDFSHVVANICKNSTTFELPNTLKYEYSLECYEKALAQLYYYHSLGIPSALDMAPAWGNMNGLHYWATVIDPFFYEFLPAELNFRKIPKVYRILYRRNDLGISAKQLCKLVENSFLHDATNLYIPTVNVNLKFDNSMNGEVVYLCVFNTGKWRPVCYTKVDMGEVCFKNMGYDIVYIPMYYDENEMKFLGEPFLLHRDGKMEKFHCTNERIDFTLLRKYPNNSLGIGGASMVGATFECSNDANFSDYTTFHTVNKNTLMAVQDVVCPSEEFRYWRISPKLSASIAEISFISSDSLLNDFDVNSDGLRISCFDKDPLTYGHIRGELIFDFKKKISIDTIRYLPMNDGNGIYPDNLYELYYWAENEWKLFQRILATNYSLSFKNVPAGGLYWLRNVTTGTQERIFVLKDELINFY